jgi:hypothetical protein
LSNSFQSIIATGLGSFAGAKIGHGATLRKILNSRGRNTTSRGSNRPCALSGYRFPLRRRAWRWRRVRVRMKMIWQRLVGFRLFA